MTPDIYFSRWPGPVGELTLYADDGHILAITFPENDAAVLQSLGIANLVEHSMPCIRQAITELQEYFAGTRLFFDVPLAPRGTGFQRAVWAELGRISFGTTVSYKYLAARVKSDRAWRAVGSANAKNPIAIMIPCHRVIGADGRLGGFSGGTAIKARLIACERLRITAAIN